MSSPDCLQPPLRYSAGVPLGWDSRRLKFSVKLRNEKVDAECIGSAYIGLENIESWTGRLIEAEVASGEGVATKFNKDDVLFGKLRPYLAKVYLASESGISSTETLVLTAENILTPSFLKFVLLSSKFIDSVSGSAYGAKMPRANWDFIGGYSVLIPPLKQQQQIADFLDFKATKIDALIAKKRALIELLKEKRLAVITHAVTKGINPDVSFFQSGVTSIGLVPEHWRVIRLRYCTNLVTSGSRGWAEYFAESGALFLRITNLDRESIDLLLEDIQRVEPPEGAEGARTLTRPGDLLVSITADLGSVAVIPDGLEPAYVSQHLALMRLDTIAISPYWVALSIFSKAGKFQLQAAGYGGTKVQLSLGDIKEIEFTYPCDVDEQVEIVNYVRSESSRIDKIIYSTCDVIDHLIEYRAALIGAAVTGNINSEAFKVGASNRP